MKLSIFAAIAAVIGGSFLIPFPTKAAYCMPFSDCMTMKEVRDGGSSWQQAWDATRQERSYDGTELCALRIKGQWKQNEGVTLS